MDIRDSIWTDFVHYKFGDDYLSEYIKREKSYRKYFKIITLLLSASGVWSAFQELKSYTIIFCLTIGLVQIISLIEGFIISSEKDLEEISGLRLMYYNHWNKLEKLCHCYDTLNDEQCKDQFFTLRNEAKEIEQVADKMNIRKYKGLMKKADIATRKYLNEYHNA